MQRLLIAGRVGKDAELRRTQGAGDPVLGFTVAVDNGKDKPATWYDAAIWGKRAEAAQSYIRKGMSITLIGRPTVRVHDGKAYMGISVDDFTFQSKASEGNSDAGGYQDRKPQGGAPAGGYDDGDRIPFAAW